MALVTLTVVGGNIIVNPDPVTLDKDEWVTFVAGDANIYDVKIDQTSLFNTSRKVLKYQVYDRNPQDTPTTKPNPGPNSTPVDYIVDATTVNDTISIIPNAPPKIIINPHP